MTKTATSQRNGLSMLTAAAMEQIMRKYADTVTMT